jgi:hypothetical protein
MIPKQFWIPKDQAKIETTPGDAKSHNQKAAKKGETKWITP